MAVAYIGRVIRQNGSRMISKIFATEATKAITSSTQITWEKFKNMGRVLTLDSAHIKFSQHSVNDVNHLVERMTRQGWKGAPIDVVRLQSGELVTLDNTRLLAASRTGG